MKLEKERIYWENGIYWLKFGCKFCSFLGKISEFWLLFCCGFKGEVCLSSLRVLWCLIHGAVLMSGILVGWWSCQRF